MRRLRVFFSFVKAIRAQIFVSVLAVLVLAVPQQTIEIYRSITQSLTFGFMDYSDRLWEVVAAAVGLAVLAFAIWENSQRALYKKWLPCHPMAASVGCAVVAVLPLIAVAVGCYRAITPAASQEVIEASKLALGDIILHGTGQVPPDPVLHKIATSILDYEAQLRWAAAGALALAAGLVAVFALLSLMKPVQAFQVKTARRSWKWLVMLLVGVFAVVLIHPPLVIALGALSTFCIFAVILSVLLNEAAIFADRTRIPVLGLAAAYVVVLSISGQNDNHRIYAPPKAPGDQAGSRDLEPLEKAFVDWLGSRPDRARYEGVPYPVYIVAAQGGGIYAAAHTALVLGGFQDRVPSFATHTFAISGVSGGSVGAALFGSILKAASEQAGKAGPDGGADPDPQPPAGNLSLVRAADRILPHDFLAPAVYGLLFPDFLQLFIPWKNVFTDRAREFEKALEEKALQEINAVMADRGAAPLKATAMQSPFLAYWHSRDTWPAVVLNTTEVVSGRRRVISPFLFDSDDAQVLALAQSDLDGMPLSTAALLSARFPWITPPGWYEQRQSRADGTPSESTYENQLVDGGYFENSGVATALDIIRGIRKLPAVRDKVSLRLIILTRGEYETKTFFGTETVSAPIRALLNTRAARGIATIQGARRELSAAVRDEADRTQGIARVQRIYLKDMDYAPPLGWRLSKSTGFLIEAQNGRPEGCVPGSGFEQVRPGRYDADCVLAAIKADLDEVVGAARTEKED